MNAPAAAALLLLSPAAVAEDPAPYRVGPGDVLEVVVTGRPDLSRLPTVQTTGTIWLPRAGEVHVRELTTDEIAARVAQRLAGEDLASPEVTVVVREYQSQFVWVRGAVLRPGRKPLRSGTRLVDALLDAGGFAAGASGEVLLERPGGSSPGGAPTTTRLRFRGGDPTPGELEQLALLLRAGDVVTAGTQRWVTVSGAVRKPGRYPFEEGLTLGRLVETAGGILRSGGERVVVVRGQGRVEADVGAIRSGDAEDVVLQPGDEVAVRTRRP